MRKARIMVTNICNRNCDGCCNKDPIFEPKQIQSIKEILDYDEIIITGGDPALFPHELFSMIFDIRVNKEFKGKIYLYTSSVMSNDTKGIFNLIDGLQHTIHEDATDFDVMEMKRLSQFLLNKATIENI